MGTTRYERRIKAPADVVWSLICEPVRITEWFPGVVSATMDGPIRTITLRTGITMPEQILTNDPLLRRFQYRITSPIYRFHLGTIDVIELDPQECLCVYSTTAEPNVMALVVGGGTSRALGEIERLSLALVGK